MRLSATTIFIRCLLTAVIVCYSAFFYNQLCLAYDFGNSTGLNKTKTQIGYKNMETSSLATVIGTIIGVITSLFGIVFMVIVIMGGYDILTAGGNEENVKKGLQKIKQGVMGLVIVFAAYLISYFILTVATGGVFKIS